MATRTTKKSVNHLRAWREFRELSQDQLGKAIGTAGNVIGNLEAGERQLSETWLKKLAPALGTKPGILLDYAPEDVNHELLEALMEVPEQAQDQALVILKSFRLQQEGVGPTAPSNVQRIGGRPRK